MVGNVDIGGGCACVGDRGYMEIFSLSTQFCYEPKTALKIRFLNILKSNRQL
jgi:hypothetical protein